MPFDKFVDLPAVREDRRKQMRASLRGISIDELRKLAKEHQDEFVDDPSRDKLLRLIEERPRASFYHAVPQENIVVIYCRDEDFGLWVLPGSGMGPLDETGKGHIREAITLAASDEKVTSHRRHFAGETQNPKSTKKFAWRAQLLTSHFRLPTSSAFAQHTVGTTLGLSAKELI
jgi:hypothetical protein